MTRISTKSYQGKYKIHVTLKNKQNIQKVLIWNKQLNEYLPPANGKAYRARRYDMKAGERVRVTSYFATVDEAISWQYGHQTSVVQNVNHPIITGPLFQDIVKEWKECVYSSLASTTCEQYDKLLTHHFQTLMIEPIDAVNAKRVDQLIAEWKQGIGATVQSGRRKSFSHELTLLGIILNYYREYNNNSFVNPILKRHRKDIKLRHNLLAKSKDLQPDEFLHFREKLRNEMHGKLFFALATLQFYLALRISEAAALHWEDIHLDFENQGESKISVRRSIQWSRTRDKKSKLVSGYKNAKSNEGVKELPMFPAVFHVLKELYTEGATGLVFRDQGTFFEYRQLQKAYDNAFKAAGLEYTGTHVMRHGGCRAVYNETGDLSIAAQLLGNSDMETVQVYAKRDKGALKKLTKAHWTRFNSSSELGAAGSKPTIGIEMSLESKDI